MRSIAPPHQFGKNQRSTSVPFGRRAKRRHRLHRAARRCHSGKDEVTDRRGRFRRFLTAFCCSRHHLVRRIASPLWAPVLEGYPGSSGIAGQSRRASAKCETAQEQAPRGRDLQSTLLFFGSFGKDPIRH